MIIIPRSSVITNDNHFNLLPSDGDSMGTEVDRSRQSLEDPAKEDALEKQVEDDEDSVEEANVKDKSSRRPTSIFPPTSLVTLHQCNSSITLQPCESLPVTGGTDPGCFQVGVCLSRRHLRSNSPHSLTVFTCGSNN